MAGREEQRRCLVAAEQAGQPGLSGLLGQGGLEAPVGELARKLILERRHQLLGAQLVA
jgi:hypothetical protein